MIEFKHVSKRFGRTVALEDVTVTYPRGKIIGLFGPNGAGKSTSLKMIVGLNRPNLGEVTIDGKSPQDSKHQVAYLPEIDYIYPWMTIADAADFLKPFYSDWDEAKFKDLLGFLNLDKRMKIGRISRGQRAKTKLLLNVSRQAPYLLMDEPLSGIDIMTREEIINTLIRDYREGEQTIVISTHEIADVESLIEEVVFIADGRIQLVGNAEDLRHEREASLVNIMKELFKNAN